MYDSHVSAICESRSVRNAGKFGFPPTEIRYWRQVSTFHRLSGNHKESKSYFIEKHCRYGYQCDLSVFFRLEFPLDSLFIAPDLSLTLILFFANLTLNRIDTKKREEERGADENDELHEEYRNNWTIFGNKS